MALFLLLDFSGICLVFMVMFALFNILFLAVLLSLASTTLFQHLQFSTFRLYLDRNPSFFFFNPVSFDAALRIQVPFRPWASANQSGGMCSDSESAGGSSESRSMDSPTASPGNTTRAPPPSSFHSFTTPLHNEFIEAINHFFFLFFF